MRGIVMEGGSSSEEEERKIKHAGLLEWRMKDTRKNRMWREERGIMKGAERERINDQRNRG